MDFEGFRAHLKKTRSNNCNVDNWISMLKLRMGGCTYRDIGMAHGVNATTAMNTVKRADKAYSNYLDLRRVV